MRQLITRLDDDLHARLKERAQLEGRSLNALVTEALAAAVGQVDARRRLRERAAARGLLATVQAPERVPDRAAALDATRGIGQLASEAVDGDRARQ